MKQEDKELLLKDLSARLPYGVKAQVRINVKYSDAHKPNSETWIGDIWGITTNKPYTAWIYSFITIYPCGPEQNMCSISECKPYLRSMSDMTEDERKEYNDIVKNTIDFYDCPKSEDVCFFIVLIDWLNAHHFDYRGLIERGLAIKVTPDNNPYKRKRK